MNRHLAKAMIAAIKLQEAMLSLATDRGGMSAMNVSVTLDQMEAWTGDITDFVERMRDQQPAETPPDTPSLDTSFHDHEMDVEC